MPLAAKLSIDVGLRTNKTILQKSFCTQPFKLANVTEGDSSGVLRLMLMSSSPGVLDGDSYCTDITVGEGCSLQLETQSYQRIFTMKHGAVQHTTVTLLPNSAFFYLPHPVVPHEDANLKVHNKIFLHEGCSLVWGDVISCGRKLNGEVFRFSLYHSITEIYLNKKLVVKENLRLAPSQTNLNAIGQLEGFTHQATLLFLNENVDVADIINQLCECLQEEKDISFGVSALPVNGLVVRILGHKAEQLFLLLKNLSLLLPIKNSRIKNEWSHVS